MGVMACLLRKVAGQHLFIITTSVNCGMEKLRPISISSGACDRQKTKVHIDPLRRVLVMLGCLEVASSSYAILVHRRDPAKLKQGQNLNVLAIIAGKRGISPKVNVSEPSCDECIVHRM